MEAVSAYLNGTLKETVLMQQPEMFRKGMQFAEINVWSRTVEPRLV